MFGVTMYKKKIMSRETGVGCVPVDATTHQRWESLLTRVERCGNEGLWTEVDESSQEWQDLTALEKRGVVFQCGLRCGGKLAGWYSYTKSRGYFARNCIPCQTCGGEGCVDSGGLTP